MRALILPRDRLSEPSSHFHECFPGLQRFGNLLWSALLLRYSSISMLATNISSLSVIKSAASIHPGSSSCGFCPAIPSLSLLPHRIKGLYGLCMSLISTMTLPTESSTIETLATASEPPPQKNIISIFFFF